jgi:hypothetical protein
MKKDNIKNIIEQKEYKDGTIEYYLNGILHCENGPAIIKSSGCMLWYRHGVLHRTNGPAIEPHEGVARYFLTGIEYSSDEFDKFSEKNTIHITISGVTGSGKTTISKYLNKIFSQIGFDCENLDEDVNYENHIEDSNIEGLLNTLKRQSKVSINTTRMLRRSREKSTK